MLESVLVANRGEIARRVIRTVRAMGIRAIAVYSDADAGLPFVREADEAVLLGPAPPARSYLDIDAVIGAARQAGASAIHPGYGFLAENPAFAARVLAEGLTWIGPPPSAIEQMGDKISARNLMERAGVPVAAGTREPVTDAAAAVAEASRIGYPVMVKAAAGGGGIGMTAAANPAELRAGFETARSRAERFFGNPAILLERYIEPGPPRRDTDSRAERRERDRARRAGLLRAAAASESRRGDALARDHARVAGPDAGRRRPGRPRRSDTAAPGRSSAWWTRRRTTSFSWK